MPVLLVTDKDHQSHHAFLSGKQSGSLEMGERILLFKYSLQVRSTPYLYCPQSDSRNAPGTKVDSLWHVLRELGTRKETAGRLYKHQLLSDQHRCRSYLGFFLHPASKVRYITEYLGPESWNRAKVTFHQFAPEHRTPATT